MGSVKDWAAGHGFVYRTRCDDLFATIPEAIRDKLAGRTPVMADLARLDWLTSVLSERAGLVIWVDADTVVLNADWRPPCDTHSFFGEECWVQQDDKSRWRAYLSPHNAFMGFTEASPVLPFLRYLSLSLIERADAAFIAPQMIGPKLLKALHSLADFELVPEAGALSPALLAEWVHGYAGAQACYARHNRPDLAMINLCGSLSAEPGQRALIEAFLDRSQV